DIALSLRIRCILYSEKAMALHDRPRRVLLLLPTTTYRAPDFLAAAERLGVEVVAASEKPNVMARRHPEGLLTLDFRDPEAAARRRAGSWSRDSFRARSSRSRGCSRAAS